MSSSSPSGVGARVRVSKCLICGEVIVLRVMGMETLSYRLLCGDYGCRRCSSVVSGVMDASFDQDMVTDQRQDGALEQGGDIIERENGDLPAAARRP